MKYEIFKHYNTDQIPSKQVRKTSPRPTTMYFGDVPELDDIVRLIGQKTLFAHVKQEAKEDTLTIRVGKSVCHPNDSYSRKEGNRLAKESSVEVKMIIKQIALFRDEAKVLLNLPTTDFAAVVLNYKMGSSWPTILYMDDFI